MPYATPEEFRKIAHEAEDGTEAVALYEALIERASRAFDRLCGVADGYFEAAAEGSEATARTFYGDGTGFLKLPPYVAGSISSLTVPSGYTAPTYIERDGYLVASTSGVVTAHVGGFYSGVPITVTARWGFAETPGDVVQAVLMWAIHFWRMGDPVKARTATLEGQFAIGDAPAYTKMVAGSWRMKGKAAFA